MTTNHQIEATDPTTVKVLQFRDRLRAIQGELFEMHKEFEEALGEEDHAREVVDAAGNVTASDAGILCNELAHALGPIIRVMAEQFDPEHGMGVIELRG
jgi:hypothetical protein